MSGVPVPVPVPVAPRREEEDANNEGQRDTHISMLQRLNPSNPLRVAVSNGPRSSAPPHRSSAPPPRQSAPRQVPAQQPPVTTLNSTKYTDKITLLLFGLHLVASIALAGFLVFKGIHGLILSSSVKHYNTRMLKLFLPQAEAASLLSVVLAVIWQQAFRKWPRYMSYVSLWGSVAASLTAGSLVICFERAATNGLGACLIVFAICNGLYACWVNERVDFCGRVLEESLIPVPKFNDLNHPTYLMMTSALLFMSFWVFAIIGALKFFWPPLVIIILVLSFAWTAEVMRNVVNQTISRVVSLYYLRGIESGTKYSFQRAISKNLGSACLGSLFVPAIEALKIFARCLNLLEGEDEFMFSCGECCLNVMEAIFRYGNGWAFVQIATYGKSFVQASLDTWQLFELRKMVTLVDTDITSSVCFLTGICSGSICIIVVAAWTQRVHPPYTASVSLLAGFIGYLMTRIAMALPQACVSCQYVWFAENPDNGSFYRTLKDRLKLLEGDGGAFAPTPRIRRRMS